MMRLKTILTTFVGLTLLASCSDGDGYDYGNYQADATANYTSAATLYHGTWQAVDLTSSQKNVTTSGDIALQLSQGEPMLTISQLPVQLFLQLAGRGDATVEMAQPYNIRLQEKGYSSATVVYEATMTPYTFTFRQGGELHQLRLSFQDRSEVAVNTYLNTLSTVITLTAISIDDAPAEAVGLSLSISAEKR
ncbi:MAG: hypothetical protein IJ243_02040 [Prevotella sp.]|nr:hypothetical protein [Prevotella sp.]